MALNWPKPSNCFTLILSGYQAPSIILDIQPGGNHVIEDSHKKVCFKPLSVDRSPRRDVQYLAFR